MFEWGKTKTYLLSKEGERKIYNLDYNHDKRPKRKHMKGQNRMKWGRGLPLDRLAREDWIGLSSHGEKDPGCESCRKSMHYRRAVDTKNQRTWCRKNRAGLRSRKEANAWGMLLVSKHSEWSSSSSLGSSVCIQWGHFLIFYYFK